MRIGRDTVGTIGITFVSTALAVMSMSCASSSSMAEGTELTEGVFSQREVDVPARLIGCGLYDPDQALVLAARPRYRRGFQVVLGVTVDPNGMVRQVQLDRATNFQLSPPRAPPTVIAEAEALAWQCEFEPAQIGGQPVAVQRNVRFRLSGN